ncbi:MAG: hypothetical protein PHX21_12820 [bacterium]|nr:hypothetical protein [bacterium]
MESQLNESGNVRYVTINDNLDLIKLMGKRAGEYSTNEIVDEWAERLHLKGGVPEMFEFARSVVVYNKDPIIMDTLRMPDVLLKRIAKEGRTSGDCDCASLLLGTMLLNRGYPIRFIAAHIIGKNEPKSEYNGINHVFLDYRDEDSRTKAKNWVALEPSAKDKVPVGYQAPNCIRLYEVYPKVKGQIIK